MLVTSIDFSSVTRRPATMRGVDAERLLNLRELRTAAVHEHDADADLVQDRDLLDQRTRRGGIAEHAAARLDDEHLALVHADVRRGAAQRANGNGRIGAEHGDNLADSELRTLWH